MTKSVSNTVAGKVFTACYATHPVKRFHKNPLIRALTPLPDDNLTLQRALTRFPEWDASERKLGRPIRKQLLQGLFAFFLGLPRVVELLETIHALICAGYLGRQPFSPADQARRQRIYEMQQNGEFYSPEEEEDEEAHGLSTALIGSPGSGKTWSIKRITRHFRRVIHHPELGIFQIPVLLIEMAYSGMSILTLAQRIIRAIHKLFPQANYLEHYLGKAVRNVEVLFLDAIQLMQTHYVGLLIVDEGQNREYRSNERKPTRRLDESDNKKGGNKQHPLATLLIAATNEAGIPILMVGTPELRDVLAARYSMLRRLFGRGTRIWKPLSLPKHNLAREVMVPGEFDVFLTVLWNLQWTKTPFELTSRMRNLFYYYSQGFPDTVVKLFHAIQSRAISNGGDELVDEELVHDVARDELQLLTEVSRKLRDMDYDALGKFDDLAAYLRIDRHELNFDRRLAQEGFIDPFDTGGGGSEGEDEDAQDEGTDEGDGRNSDTPLPLADPPLSPRKKGVNKVPETTNCAPKRASTSKPKPKPKPKPKCNPPSILPVDDLDDELDR